MLNFYQYLTLPWPLCRMKSLSSNRFILSKEDIAIDPKLTSALTRAFNQFVKDIFHSSTLSQKIRISDEGIYQFIGTGISNRLMKNIYLSYGENFTNDIAIKLVNDNISHLISLMKAETGKDFEFIELQPRSSFEYFMVTLREINN